VGALVMIYRLCEPKKKKKKNRPKILSYFFGEKNFNFDFSVLRTISQQKVLVGTLAITYANLKKQKFRPKYT
jgi:hypothetical protein